MLDVVSVVSLAGATGAVALLALARRRVALALAAATLVGGANVTTQLLKKVLLERPDVGAGVFGNSFPSGHTTVATSVGLAAVLVVPARLRPPVALLATAWAAATGTATLVSGGHRPSDVAGAALVTLGWALALAAALAATGRGTGAAPSRPGVVLVGVVSVLGTVAVAAAGLGGTALVAVADAYPVTTPEGRLVAYAGGVGLVVAAVAAAGTVWLVVVDRVLRDRTGRPAGPTAPRQ